MEEEIGPALLGQDCADQGTVDQRMIELDGTANKGRLGANAILAVSMASAKAAAEIFGLPLYRYLGGVQARTLPVPFMNVVNGGQHADNPLDVQEFLLVPHGFTRFSDALRAGVEIFHSLKGRLKAQGLATSVGDEGGFAPQLSDTRAVLDLLVESISAAGYTPGTQVSLAMDVAASELYRDGRYTLERQTYSATELVETYAQLCSAYPIVSIEDGLAEDDWEGWAHLTATLGGEVQILGDDIFVTNPERLERGIQQGSANSILIKMNQIGSLSETFETMALAGSAGFRCQVSHRSGETEDTTLADLVVATNAGQIKTGSASRTDRVSKYNQLLRIEEELASAARFAGTGRFLARTLAP